MDKSTNKYDVCVALIWALSLGVPMFLLASNLQDLSEVKVAAVGTLMGSLVHGIFKTLTR